MTEVIHAATDRSLDLLRALADETRLRIVRLLRGGELCLCQITSVIDLAPSTLSQHLNLLHRAGLLHRRKDGKWHYYRLVSQSQDPRARALLRWALQAQGQASETDTDAAKLREVLTSDRSELVGCYSRTTRLKTCADETCSHG